MQQGIVGSARASNAPPQPASNNRGQSGRMQQPGNAARNANKQLNNSTAVSDPYMRCIAGPTSMASTGVGFPDGSTRQSVVVDFKQSYTITPVSGTIRFALTSGPLGCLALNCGNIATGVICPRYSTTTTLAYGWTAQNPATSGGDSWFVLPFRENASTTITGPTLGPYAVGEYRGLVYTADAMFTGSDNLNGGVVRVARFNVSKNLGTGVQNTVPVRSISYTEMNDAFMDNSSGRFTGAARDSINLRGINPRPEFVDVEDSAVIGYEIVPFGLNSSNALTSTMLWCGIDTNVPVTIVEYSGLDATASITVEVRSCLEMTPAPGAMSGFSKPSPPCNLSSWQKVANFARAIPPAIVQTAGKAAFAYLTGGSSAAAMAIAGLL